MNFTQKLNLTSHIVFFGTGISFLYHFSMGYFFKFRYPYNTFLFSPEDRFMDFLWPYIIASNPYHIPRHDFQNFPVLYRLASISTLLTPDLALELFLGLFTLGILLISFAQMQPAVPRPGLFRIFALVSLTFCSYPFLIAFDRANYEIVVFFCLYLYIALYGRYPVISAGFLGIAVALKAFPAVMGILLLSDKRYKEIACAAIIALITTLACYASFPGGMMTNIANHLRNLSLYNQIYAVGNWGLGFGHSIFGALKFLLYLVKPELIALGAPKSLILSYMVLAIVLLISISIYVMKAEKSFWKKVILVVCALNLFPLVSADYKLLHLLIPFYLFLNNKEELPTDLIIVILFSLLFIPKSYWHLPGLPEVSIAVLLNPILMLTMVIMIVKQEFRIYLPAPETTAKTVFIPHENSVLSN